MYTIVVRATLERHGGYTVTRADRGENQREKSKVSPLPVSPYYTTLSCTQTHYLVHTDPMLHRPLIDSGCTYTSYFTSMVTLEVKAEQSSDLRVEWSSEMGAERSSDSKRRMEWSSNLGLATTSTGVSSLRFLWLFWGDSLWDLSSGSLDGRHVSPSCSRPSLIGRESLWGNPSSSFLV